MACLSGIHLCQLLITYLYINTNFILYFQVTNLWCCRNHIWKKIIWENARPFMGCLALFEDVAQNIFTYPYYLSASEQCSLFPTGIALILGIIIWSWKRTCNSLDGHTLLKPRLGNRYVYSSCVWKMKNCRCLVLSSVWKWKYSTTIHTTTFCQMMEDSFLICSPVTKNPWTGGWWWK